MTSPHFLISKTSIASKVISSSTVAFLLTPKTVKETSSPVVPITFSAQAWGMAPSSYVISEVKHLSPITPTTDTLRKTTPRGKSLTSTTEVPPNIGRKKHDKTCLVPDFSGVYFLQVVRMVMVANVIRVGHEIFVNRFFNIKTTSPSLL